MAAPEKRSTDKEPDWIAKLGEIHEEFTVPEFLHALARNAENWAQEISAGPYWSTVKDRLPQWRTEFSSDLLPRRDLPNFESKPESSIRDKLIRKCRENQDNLSAVISEDAPPPIPRMNDLVRIRVSCSYIDGVEFLAQKLEDLAKEMGCSPKLEREGKVEGYFAQHLTLDQSVIYRYGGPEQVATIRCEIQLATELATQVWKSSHGLYERVRGLPNAPEDWQWKPNDLRFMANQLGHMIHLADGLLIDLRDKTNIGKN